jgi:hypothetical protein
MEYDELASQKYGTRTILSRSAEAWDKEGHAMGRITKRTDERVA